LQVPLTVQSHLDRPMNIATAPGPWPAPAAASGAWRFARLVPSQPQGDAGSRLVLQWVLRRNCSITPRQLLAVYLSLCTVSLAVGLGFWWHGAAFVLGFAGFELLMVGVALLIYARHAADRDLITLDGRDVHVEQYYGRQVERMAFRAEWLSVEPAHAQGSLVELTGQGRRARIGRFLRPELRAALAQELRRAVRLAQAGLPPQESELEPKR
jgi:uncharacterized membrane protein